MEAEKIRQLLSAVQAGNISIDDAMQKLSRLPYENLGDFVRIDHHRHMRKGFPEVIFSQGKTPEQILRIFTRLSEMSDKVLATRLDAGTYTQIASELPESTYNPIARCLYLDRTQGADRLPGVVVLTGGTSDMPVAEEAALTAELMGNEVQRYYDVGVAGLHRLLDNLPALQAARVVIAAAGMEGALPSVIAGLVSVPVIAVPTSIGYGASFNGLAALLTMLNSCANGVSVVNIDNGFGAGYLAATINRLEMIKPRKT